MLQGKNQTQKGSNLPSFTQPTNYRARIQALLFLLHQAGSSPVLGRGSEGTLQKLLRNSILIKVTAALDQNAGPGSPSFPFLLLSMVSSQGEKLGRERIHDLLDLLKGYASSAHAQILCEQHKSKSYVTP